MPLVVLSARHDLDKVGLKMCCLSIIDISQCLAYIFLVGSTAGTSTTVSFLYVLARFPGFIRHVKSEGADPDVVIRLATFYQLNVSCHLLYRSYCSLKQLGSVFGLSSVAFLPFHS